MFRRLLDLIVSKNWRLFNLSVTSWTSRQHKKQQVPCSSLSTTGSDGEADMWCHSVAPESAMGAFARVVLMADWIRDMSCLCLKCCVTSFPKEYTSTWRAASGSIPLALQADKSGCCQCYKSRLCFTYCCAGGTNDAHVMSATAGTAPAGTGVTGSNCMRCISPPCLRHKPAPCRFDQRLSPKVE